MLSFFFWPPGARTRRKCSIFPLSKGGDAVIFFFAPSGPYSVVSAVPPLTTGGNAVNFFFCLVWALFSVSTAPPLMTGGNAVIFFAPSGPYSVVNAVPPLWRGGNAVIFSFGPVGSKVDVSSDSRSSCSHFVGWDLPTPKWSGEKK